MRIYIRDLMDREDVLFGVAGGRACLAKLLGAATEAAEPTVLFLDFSGVISATVSFLREGPLAFREMLRSKSSNLYPVFANLTPAVSDSLAEFLSTVRDAVFACDLTEGGAVGDVRILGQLEPKQDLTFRAVVEFGKVTAGELAAMQADVEEVGVTAWNNRLAALSGKGLLMEYRNGRRKTFKVALEEAV